jgi:hypothetical protein
MRLLYVAAVCFSVAGMTADPDTVLFDFESGSFRGWTIEGANPFGPAPFAASDEVRKWRSDRSFTGWQGKYMLIAGDTRSSQVPPGRILSPEFRITHPFLKFLLGGEAHPRVRVSLLVEGNEVRTAFGNNSYDLRLRGWDVSEFLDKRARIAIEDTADVPSLMRVDHFVLSSTPPPPVTTFEESRQESEALRFGELKHVFDPGPGRFVAHASVMRGLDDRWHLYAQIAPLRDRNRPEAHKTIWHATARDLFGPWSAPQAVLTADPAAGENFLWQPFAMVYDNTYWMFYVGSGVPWKGWDRNNNWRAGDFGKASTQGPYGIHLATSKDGFTWKRHSNLPLFTDSPFAFTPFVTRLKDRWVMYYASAEPADIAGKHAIVARTSPDLVQWEARRVVLLDSTNTTPWPEYSYFHSPLVFRRGEYWYILAGPTTASNQGRLQYRKLFRSQSALRWDATRDLKGIFLDGGANLVRNENGQLFLTHTSAKSGGVWIAPLVWNADWRRKPTLIDDDKPPSTSSGQPPDTEPAKELNPDKP